MFKITRNTFTIIALSCALLIGLGILVNTIASNNHMTLASEEDTPMVFMRASFVSFSDEELMENSALVVHAKVTGESEAFVIESQDGGMMTYTDYYVEPYEILRGEDSSSEIAVRVMGGKTSESIVETDFSPNFEVGKNYVLFLTIPAGGDYDAPGEYYYLVGGPQGVFPQEDLTFVQRLAGLFGNGSNSNDIFVQDSSGDELSLSDLRDSIAEVNENVPIPDENSLIAEANENLRKSVENGVFVMTEEELQEEFNKPRRPGKVRGGGYRPGRPGRN